MKSKMGASLTTTLTRERGGGYGRGVADEEVLDDNTDKRGEEGMAGVWRVWHSAPLSALAGDEMGANLDLGGLGDSKCHPGDGAKCGGFCAN